MVRQAAFRSRHVPGPGYPQLSLLGSGVCPSTTQSVSVHGVGTKKVGKNHAGRRLLFVAVALTFLPRAEPPPPFY